MKHVLKINDIEANVYLGCWPGEQDQPQKVLFSLDIEFSKPLAAGISDRIEEALDYSHLVIEIQKQCDEKKYALVEHLGLEVMRRLVEFLSFQRLNGSLKLSTKKIQIPIPEIKKGVEFICQQSF